MDWWTWADLAPGALVVLLGTGLFAALRRWFDPLPGRVAAVFAGVLFLLFAPVLFGGFVLLPLDMLAGMPPWHGLPGNPLGVNALQWDNVMQGTPGLAIVREATAAGEWPLWNAFSAAGMPLLGDPQPQPLQPFALLTRVLPLHQAPGAIAALRVLATLVFAFLFFRRQGAGELPALAGSLALGLGAWTLHWLGWHETSVSAALAAVLYGLALTADRGRRRDFVFLGASVFTLLTAGHPETILYGVLAGGAFALARLLDRSGRTHRERLALAGRWLACGAAAFALAAPVVLPVAEYLPQMIRHLQVEAGQAAVRAEGPWAGWRTPEERQASLDGMEKRLVATVAPGAFGDWLHRPYWGFDNPNEDTTGYVGTAALLAALLALWPARRRLPQERLFLGMAWVSLAVVARPPGLLYVLESLPGLSHSASRHHRLLLLLAFATAYLAAAVLERVRANGQRREDQRGESWQGPPAPVVGIVALGLGGLLAWAFAAHPNPQDPSALAALRTAWLTVQLLTLAIATACLLAARRRPATLRKKPPSGAPRSPAALETTAEPARADVAAETPATARLAFAVFAATVAVELLAFHLPLHPPAVPRLFYPETEEVRFLQERLGGPGRPGGYQRFAGVGATFFAMTPAVRGLPDARHSGPTLPAPYHHLVGPLRGGIDDWGELFHVHGSPLYDLLAVRYLLTWPHVALPPPAREVLRTPRSVIWERPGALPLLYLPRAAAHPRGRDWRQWLLDHPRYRRRSLVEWIPGDAPAWQAQRPWASRIHRIRVDRARAWAEVELAEPRLLASSLYQDSRWRVLVDGEVVPPLLVNGPFVGAWLPAGRYRVELIYRPASFVAGCALAGLGVLALLLAAVPPPRQMRAR
ncbi:MAG TPA: hypothetical protein VHQ65_07715 [Thermoanaerobaculia bacterium]|nr:hypothetical protein [Thermoanaerobaculia bacterium]